MAEHVVVVGNIGTVFTGSTRKYARQAYKDYVKLSKDGYGRAAGESVTRFVDGKIIQEYVGTVDQEEMD